MPRWRIPRLRFSLLTLLLAVLFAGACFGLWWRWEPWVRSCGSLNSRPRGLGGLAFSTDGRLLAALGNTESSCVWDVTTGALLLETENKDLWSFRFAPDDLRMVGIADYGDVTIWDLASGRPTVLLKDEGSTEHVGKYVASHRRRGDGIFVYALDTGVSRVLDPSGCAIPRGSRMGLGSKLLPTYTIYKTSSLWNLETGLRLYDLDYSLHPVRESPDASHLLFETDNQQYFVMWDVPSNRELWRTRKSDTGSELSFSPDSKTFFVGGEGVPYELCDTTTGASLVFFGEFTGGIYWSAFSDDGRRIFTLSDDDVVRVWDASNGRVLARIQLPYHPLSRDKFAAASSDGNLIATCSIADDVPVIWTRRRPEYWWGIAWLPEFWVAYFSCGALLVIAARNLRRRFAETAATPRKQ